GNRRYCRPGLQQGRRCDPDRRRPAGPAGVDPTIGRRAEERLRRGLRDAHVARGREQAEKSDGLRFLSGNQSTNPRQDSPGYRGLPVTQPAGRELAAKAARTAPLYERSVYLDRLCAKGYSLSPRPAVCRRDEVELLAPVEFRPRG